MGTPEIALNVCEFVVLLFALSLHESAHGWMASRLGDQTARMLGRITLNPIKHIDPVGTVMLPLVVTTTLVAVPFVIAEMPKLPPVLPDVAPAVLTVVLPL